MKFCLQYKTVYSQVLCIGMQILGMIGGSAVIQSVTELDYKYFKYELPGGKIGATNILQRQHRKSQVWMKKFPEE